MRPWPALLILMGCSNEPTADLTPDLAALEDRVEALEESSSATEAALEAHDDELAAIAAQVATLETSLAALEVAVAALEAGSGSTENPISISMSPATAPAFTYGDTPPVLVVTLSNNGTAAVVTNGVQLVYSTLSIGSFFFHNTGVVGDTTYSTAVCKQLGMILEPSSSCDHVITFNASAAGTTTVLFSSSVNSLGDGIARTAYLDPIVQVVNAP